MFTSIKYTKFEIFFLVNFCFYFPVPESYETFKSLLAGRTIEQQLIILERIQKCNHPSLAVGNKAKLEVRDFCCFVGFFLRFKITFEFWSKF